MTNHSDRAKRTSASRLQAPDHTGHLPSSDRALSISAWLTGVKFLIELLIGLWTGLVAVISDAFHTFSAVRGVLVADAA